MKQKQEDYHVNDNIIASLEAQGANGTAGDIPRVDLYRGKSEISEMLSYQGKMNVVSK